MVSYRIRLETERDSLTLSPYSSCRVLDGGISGFDYPKTAVRTSEHAFSDGGIITERAFLSREIELYFEVVKREAFKDLRDVIIRLMSPEGDVKITSYLFGRRRFITGTPSSPPEFIYDNFSSFPRVRLKLTCADPFFSEGHFIGSSLPIHTPLFTFPLNLMNGAGCAASFTTGSYRHRIYNPGDVACGFRLTVRAVNGRVTQPFIMLNGQRLQFLESMNEGDELVFDTVTGSKKITLNGTEKFSFSKNNRFFSLEPGENDLTVQSVGDSPNLVGEISFMPLYLGA